MSYTGSWEPLVGVFPGLAPFDHLNIEAMFVLLERIQNPDIQADGNEQRMFSDFNKDCSACLNEYFFLQISHLVNAVKISRLKGENMCSDDRCYFERLVQSLHLSLPRFLAHLTQRVM